MNGITYINIYEYHIEKYVRENVCNKTREKADQRLKYMCGFFIARVQKE